jgi:hypothetical protein
LPFGTLISWQEALFLLRRRKIRTYFLEIPKSEQREAFGALTFSQHQWNVRKGFLRTRLLKPLQDRVVVMSWTL